MKLFKLFKTFAQDESGAVTVDWVVLTAAIVGLGIAAITAVSNGVTGMGNAISTELTDNSASYIGAGIPAAQGAGGDAGADAGGT